MLDITALRLALAQTCQDDVPVPPSADPEPEDEPVEPFDPDAPA